MSESVSKLANGAKCKCNNDNALKFRRFHDREKDELLGLQCLMCGCEYLKEIFIALVDRTAHILQPSRDRFYLAERYHIREDDAHMVFSAKSKVNVTFFRKELGPGDHIAWHRPWGVWHHAIITEMTSNRVCVVHWYSDICKNPDCKIREQWITLQEQKGDLYRMDYSESITKANPAQLVIARARSRIGEKGYNLLKDNCESLASFCKFGVAISQQIVWACKELKNEAKKSGLSTAGKVGIAELTEGVFKRDQLFGFTFIVIIEGIHTCIDIRDLWKARRDGRMSLKVTIEQITERLTQAIFAAGLAGLGGMVPGVGFVVGFFGGIVGKWFGSMAGPHIGQFIANLIEYDNRAICNINDLRSGDHLVLEYDNEGSHHCIVQWYEEETNLIHIIHNTEKEGIKLDCMEFVQPIYRVIYDEKDKCYTPDEVWERAVSKLGVNEYNAKTNNSKHFAQRCCMKNV